MIKIQLKELPTGKYYTIPVTPEEVTYNNGEALAETLNIINLGEVDVFRGTALDSFEFTSFFPKTYDAGYCATNKLEDPKDLVYLFTSWKDTNTPLQLIITDLNVNTTMYVAGFTPTGKGPSGDIYYNLSLKEQRHIAPRKLDPKGGGVAKRNKPTKASRPATPKAKKPATYTVVHGDTLTHISQRFGVPISTIRAKNPIIKDPDLILVGWVLKL